MLDILLLFDSRKGQERKGMTCNILDWNHSCHGYMVCAAALQDIWSPQSTKRPLQKIVKKTKINKTRCKIFKIFSMLELQSSSRWIDMNAQLGCLKLLLFQRCSRTLISFKCFKQTTGRQVIFSHTFQCQRHTEQRINRRRRKIEPS